MRDQCYIGAPNGAVICIDEKLENHELGGRIYHGYSRDGLQFLNTEQIVFKLEKFYDAMCFPYPTTNSRTFKREQQLTGQSKERRRMMSDEEMLSKHGELGTFIIRVQHRQNSSWQGRLTWMDKNQTVHFRSIWELIKLVESALDISGAPSEDEEETESFHM